MFKILKKLNIKIQKIYIKNFSANYRWKRLYNSMKFFFNKKIYILAEIYKEKLVRDYGIFIGYNTEIGENINFPHPANIVLGDGVKIGNNVTIYHGVTIGVAKTSNNGNNNTGYPYIGDNVKIYTGAIILGDIKIEDNVTIGANTVVTKSISQNSIYRTKNEYILRGNNYEI